MRNKLIAAGFVSIFALSTLAACGDNEENEINTGEIEVEDENNLETEPDYSENDMEDIENNEGPGENLNYEDEATENSNE